MNEHIGSPGELEGRVAVIADLDSTIQLNPAGFMTGYDSFPSDLAG